MSSLLYNLIFLVGLIVVAKWVISWVFFGGLYLWCYLWNHQNRWVVWCWGILNLLVVDTIFVMLLWVILSILRPDMDETKLFHILSGTFIFIIGAVEIGFTDILWEHRFWKRQK